MHHHIYVYMRVYMTWYLNFPLMFVLRAWWWRWWWCRVLSLLYTLYIYSIFFVCGRRFVVCCYDDDGFSVGLYYILLYMNLIFGCICLFNILYFIVLFFADSIYYLYHFCLTSWVEMKWNIWWWKLIIYYYS